MVVVAAEAFEVGGKFLALASAERLGVLQKSVRFKTIQGEQLAHLRVGDLALAVSLDDQRFKRLAWEFLGLGAKRLHQRVRNRNFNCRRHKFLACYNTTLDRRLSNRNANSGRSSPTRPPARRAGGPASRL